MSHIYRINRSNKRGIFSKEVPSGVSHNLCRIQYKKKKIRTVKENTRRKLNRVVNCAPQQ